MKKFLSVDIVKYFIFRSYIKKERTVHALLLIDNTTLKKQDKYKNNNNKTYLYNAFL